MQLPANTTPLLRIIYESAIGHAYKAISFIIKGPMAGTYHIKAIDQNKTTVRLRKTTRWEIIEDGQLLTVATEEMQEIMKVWQQLRIQAKLPPFGLTDCSKIIYQKVVGGKGVTYGF